MPKNDLEKITLEIEEIASKLDTGNSREKYNNFAKAILVAHYFLFVTIVWKSFDLHGDIPILAKFSLVLFGIGACFSVLRYLADYFSECMENLPDYKRLIEIEEEYGDELKEHDLEEYMHLKILTRLMKWAMTREETKDIPPFVYTIVYGLLDSVALVFSFIFLCLGLVLLGLSTI
ncbi:MAG: hypothetical protein H6860_02100 [Rhodospirillales bacterium]|nr:hypothetical protein [Rhodospirillales bacterium]